MTRILKVKESVEQQYYSRRFWTISSTSKGKSWPTIIKTKRKQHFSNWRNGLNKNTATDERKGNFFKLVKWYRHVANVCEVQKWKSFNKKKISKLKIHFQKYVWMVYLQTFFFLVWYFYEVNFNTKRSINKEKWLRNKNALSPLSFAASFFDRFGYKCYERERRFFVIIV